MPVQHIQNRRFERFIICSVPSAGAASVLLVAAAGKIGAASLPPRADRAHCPSAVRAERDACKHIDEASGARNAPFYAANAELEDSRPGYLDALLQEFRDSTFIPYLQPLYSIQYNRVYGAEVLVRKIDPHGNIQTPVEFIDVMEREHMISMVDFTMLRSSRRSPK